MHRQTRFIWNAGELNRSVFASSLLRRSVARSSTVGLTPSDTAGGSGTRVDCLTLLLVFDGVADSDLS